VFRRRENHDAMVMRIADDDAAVPQHAHAFRLADFGVGHFPLTLDGTIRA